MEEGVKEDTSDFVCSECVEYQNGAAQAAPSAAVPMETSTESAAAAEEKGEETVTEAAAEASESPADEEKAIKKARGGRPKKAESDE